MKHLLFPSQLFSVKTLQLLSINTADEIVFIEHPLFYGHRRGSGAVQSLKLNQARLVYMHVTHSRYIHYLKTHNYRVTHVPYGSAKWPLETEGVGITYIDPCDILLEAELKKKYPSAVRLDSPQFLLTRAQLEPFAGSKRLQHGQFFDKVKELRSDIHALKMLAGVKNQDTKNRAPYKKGMPQPPSPFRHVFSEVAEWERAVEWVKANGFGRNPKPSLAWDEWIRTYAIYLPVETDHAHVWLADFFKERFANYGTYQDVVLLENPLLFHSGVSIFLNNGLLTPEEVLKAAVTTKTRSRGAVSMATFEGFVRQVAGWREYARLYYHTVPSATYRRNVFELGREGRGRKGTLGREWYRGELGVEPVDKTIQWAMNYGYINHIQRLMIVSNFMTLSEHSPDALYRWMFEFSLDSYEWVMVFNCYSMGSWGDGGVAMRKPYISSANYVLQMSNAAFGLRTRGAGWTEDWNAKYRAFMKKHQDVLKHTQAWRPKVI
jgi:deoxyribodipyrimidine photolyase-related protein